MKCFLLSSGLASIILTCASIKVAVATSSDSVHVKKSIVNEDPLVSKSHDKLVTKAVEKNDFRWFPGLEALSDGSIQQDIIIIPSKVVADTIEEQRARAHSLRDQVEQSQRFRESLDAFSVTDLPIGIVKSGGPIDYSIVIDRISFSPKGSELTAFMSFAIPQTGDRIAFGGKIPLSNDGGIVGISRIYLLGDHIIKMNNTSLLTIKGSFKNNTFVEIDCNGFKGMSVEAEVEFSKDLLLPENDKGEPITDKRLKVNFQTYVQDWNELLVKISVPAFQVKGLEGIGFMVQEADLDWSDLTNPMGLTFPANYQSSYAGSGQPSLWRGFYLRKAEVRLPSKFQERQTTARTKVGIENLIIDESGFSGQAFAENLIKEGDMSGWSYSLDQIKVGFVSNQLQQFELAGKITVPVFENEGKATRMGYRASRAVDGNYIFAVNIQDKVKLPLWAADVTLYNGSGIVVKEKDDKFYPTATLNGMLSISALSQGPKAELVGVRFEQMVVSTEAPYFKPGVFGFGSGESGSKASGFPLVIRNIGIKSNPTENEVGLSLDMTINIGGDPSKEGFSGTGGLIVWGKMNTPSTNNNEKNANKVDTNWKFDKVELTAVGISIKKPNVYDLSGSIRFFDSDPVYGDGFKGEVLGKLQKIDVKAIALFGKTASYRYWFADALMEIKGGVQLAPGLAAYGFGGGFFSRMKQSAEKGTGMGQTLSGIVYQPDENSTGLRAYISFGGSPSQTAFNGDATLDVAMNRNGGINSVSLIGSAYFLTPELKVGEQIIKDGASSVASKTNQIVDVVTPRSQVYGNVTLLFDNVNDVFHGNIEVYANVVGGIVKGIGSGNKAGWAVIHFASDDWYVFIGTPDQPIGLEVARLFKSKSYFMMGKNLPGSPPPPAKVSEILGDVKLDYMRDMNALQSGSAFAFGMNFGVDTGDLRFLMFYGRFDAGTGFDIMLKNYGEAYHCEGSSGPMGVNGWYASGQAYAFVEGKIGIKVNLKFYKGDYDLINIGAASILQAKGPNPFWMKGIVGGQYRILGGLVKGQCRFEVTIGQDCKPVGESNPLQDVNMIAEVSPAKGAKDVDVFNAPQAAFNIPVGEVFDITDSEDRTRSFRARLAEFSIKDANTAIDGTLKWNTTNDVVVMDSREVFPSKKELKVLVKVVFEERVGANWQAVLFDGKSVEEVVETNFTTGEAPDFIPASNVEISYPIAGQYNFYPKEYNQGFIKLKKGQAYLFEPGAGWIQKARMTEAQSMQQFKEFDFTYSAGDKTINFALPENLSLAKLYNFQLLNIPKENKVLDANVTKVSTELLKEDQGAAQLTTKQIEGQLDLREVKSIYNSSVRTSYYATFSDKIRAYPRDERALIIFPTPSTSKLESYPALQEPFDKFEIESTTSQIRLVVFEANLTGNSWYEPNGRLAYAEYPLFGIAKINHRNPEILGLPPVRDVWVDQQGLKPIATDVVSNGEFKAKLTYNIMETVYEDFKEIQQQVANYIVNHGYPTPGTTCERIMMGGISVFSQGTYKVRVTYQIPGINKITSTNEIDVVFKLY